MPTVSDIENTPLSGLNHIDALLDVGPDWNYADQGNVIFYTFSTTAGVETDNTSIRGAITAFSAEQQSNARLALATLSAVTGIVFTEVANGDAAQIRFSNVDIVSRNTVGLCSWQSSYFHTGTTLNSYSATAWIYMDNVEWFSDNAGLEPGTFGYESLLHELGHAVGLKHPFDDDINLPAARDNTGYTLMSYDDNGSIHSTYSPYDVAALKWLYGGDGLGGALGINSTTGARFIMGSEGGDTLTGTSADDSLCGNAGNDFLNGGAGNDLAIFNGARAGYVFAATAPNALSATDSSGADGVDVLTDVELFQFTNGTYTRAQLLASQPIVPTGSAAVAAGANVAVFQGTAAAGSAISLVNAGGEVLGTGTAAADGNWSITPHVLANGAYSVTVRASTGGVVTDGSAAIAFAIASSLNVGGTGGADRLATTTGNNAVDGGSGIDFALYTGARANYTIALDLAGFGVTAKSGSDGSDMLYHIERIQFADKAVALDTAGTGGAAFRLYQAAFDRLPDEAGLGFHIWAVETAGLTLAQDAQGFIDSPEFAAKYGSLDNTAFVTQLYRNVLGREPEAAGLKFHVDLLNAGTISRADDLTFFSESPENQAAVIGSISNGMDYLPFGG
jgi:hypothetical protein